jgi:hypothetical protein
MTRCAALRYAARGALANSVVNARQICWNAFTQRSLHKLLTRQAARLDRLHGFHMAYWGPVRPQYTTRVIRGYGNGPHSRTIDGARNALVIYQRCSSSQRQAGLDMLHWDIKSPKATMRRDATHGTASVSRAKRWSSEAFF